MQTAHHSFIQQGPIPHLSHCLSLSRFPSHLKKIKFKPGFCQKRGIMPIMHLSSKLQQMNPFSNQKQLLHMFAKQILYIMFYNEESDKVKIDEWQISTKMKEPQGQKIARTNKFSYMTDEEVNKRLGGRKSWQKHFPASKYDILWHSAVHKNSVKQLASPNQTPSAGTWLVWHSVRGL